MRKPYLVRTPPFELLSGGIRVMWGLIGWLLVKGEMVLINTKVNDGSEAIGVYPEIYHGNDMNCTTIVRYILNTPGFMSTKGISGPMEFQDTDRIFVFSKIYDVFGVDDDHLLFLPIINLNLFKDQHKKRTIKCVYYGHGRPQKIKETEGAIKIPTGLGQQELADFLNECHIMYSFDDVSAMHEIARLCGCPVKVIPSGRFTKEDMLGYEPGLNGMSWGLEEDVKLDIEAFRSHYKSLWDTCNHKIDKFIELTQI